MDQRTRKLMTMHPRNEIDRLYELRKERRGLTSSQDSVDTPIQRLKGYINKRGGRLIKAIKNTDNTSTNRIETFRK